MRTLSVQLQFMPLALNCLCSVPGNLAGTAFRSGDSNTGAAVISVATILRIRGLKYMNLFEIKEL